jgi:F-type H+-transporting ATPase subunit O
MALRGLASRLPSLSRAFATATAPAGAESSSAGVPQKLFGLPARYATALYLAAAKAKCLPEVEKELKTVVKLADTDAKFAGFLSDPLNKTDKVKGLAAVLDGGKFSATTKQFFGAPAGARRQRPRSPSLIPRQPWWPRTGGCRTRTQSRTSSTS